MTAPPVRVLFIVSSLCIGGAEKHAVTLANRLDPAQVQVTFAYLKADESLLPQLHTQRLSGVVSFDVKRRLDRSVVSALVRLLDANQIDAVLCVNEYPALYATLAARRARHTPRLIEVFHTTILRTPKERLQMYLYRRLIRRFDAMVFVSFKQREYWEARSLGARHDHVIQNGIDIESFQDRFSAQQKAGLRRRLGFTEQDYVVGICAALRPEKAHLDLLGALVRLRSRTAGRIKAMIIGDGGERPRIEAFVAKHGMGADVVLTGHQQDVRPYVACCDVMVLPSRSETFSLAVLETMALGKPMVLSRVGGAEEQVVDGVSGLLFEAGDVNGLADRLAALEVPAVRRRISQAAVERVAAQFDESRMIAAYTKLFRAVTAA